LPQSKGKAQIADVMNAFIIADNIEFGFQKNSFVAIWVLLLKRVMK
jgi:hypothetical protein